MTAAEVIAALRTRGLTVATAESLTGGLLCGALTDVPGASAVVRGAVVAYASEVKADVLGVDAGLLAREGAVHPEVARQMAAGVCRVLGADVGLATTGVAGPDPQDGRPVGEVYLGLCIAGRPTAHGLSLSGGRSVIRAAAVSSGLDLLGAALRVEDPAGSDR